MSDDNDIAWSETQAAAGWPDPFADDDALDEAREREQSFWASPEGQALQLAEFRAERAKWGTFRD